MKLPNKRAGRSDLKLTINKPNKHKYGLKIAIRNEAKKLPFYHELIECNICGQDNSGTLIPINNVGKWIFGTPGYMGHAIFEGGIKEQIVIYLPKETPQKVIKLLENACSNL